MTFNGNVSSACKSLVKLQNLVHADHWGLMQLLLSISKKETFNRILCCPTFPVITKTSDFAERSRLLNDSLSADPMSIANILAILYESAIDVKNRKKNGQYFTPQNVAKEAAVLLNPQENDKILDAGSGTGAFAVELMGLCKDRNLTKLAYLGVEKDPILALCSAISLDRVYAPQNYRIVYADFVSLTNEKLAKFGFGQLNAIISNPPFIRYHRLGQRTDIADKFGISMFSGMHSYFLAQSASLLSNGKMVFIVPLEMEKTNYGAELIKKLDERFVIEKRNICYDKNEKLWYCMNSSQNGSEDLSSIASIIFLQDRSNQVFPERRELQQIIEEKSGTLKLIGSVHRGISTGANNYFLLNKDLVKKFKIPETFLTKVIPPKTPHKYFNEKFSNTDWERLMDNGASCLLLSIDPKMSPEDLPYDVMKYIKLGESKGVHLVPTSRARMPWWSVRIPKNPPDIIFTYMFRGKPKFFVNEARVFNLTNLLGIYFSHSVNFSVDIINSLNKSSESWVNSGRAGRNYAGGLTKLEPKELERMPLPLTLLRKLGVSTLL